LVLSLALSTGGTLAECISVEPVETRYGSLKALAYSIVEDLGTDVQIELRAADTSKVLQRSANGRLDRVKYGRYTVRVFVPGFDSEQVDVNVDRSEVIVRAQLAVSMECGAASSLSGSIASTGANRDLWVKLLPLRGGGGVEAPARGGYFLVTGLDAANYVLMVLDGGSVVHTEVIQVVGDKKVSIAPSANL